MNEEATESTSASMHDSNHDNNNNKKKNKRNPNKRGGWPKKKKAKGPGGGNIPPHKPVWASESEVVEVEPNGGSFANADMRQKFGVTLPSIESLGHVRTEDGENDDGEDNGKIPKRKVAMLLGFLGTNYSGMQINTGQNTLQAQLELGVYKAGLLLPSNFGFPNKYGFNNSARTDKGVHSCAQVCTMKVLVPEDNLEKARERINEQLPDDIQILDMVKVPKSFNARTQRDKVRYQYMLPSFSLLDADELRTIFDEVTGQDECLNRKGKSGSLSTEEIKTIREKLRQYRVSKETLSGLRSSLGRYEGTHYFHNYTSKLASGDASTQRFIHSFTLQDPFVDQHGIEWVNTHIVGQSFLLHQIRKMISMAIDVARGKATKEIQEESFSERYMNINVAPAQGLFLDMSYYGRFNNRPNASNPLDWHSNEKSESVKRWKDFKENKVQPHIMDEEEEQGNFIGYLFNQEYHIDCTKYRSTLQKATSSIRSESEDS